MNKRGSLHGDGMSLIWGAIQTCDLALIEQVLQGFSDRVIGPP